MSETARTPNFIRNLVADDLRTNRWGGRVITRFPPEPNGYLHIGHAKSICLNFGLAAEFGGRCHLRFDDTNPTKESAEYVESIQQDVRWLGFDWGEHLHYASDYFEQLYAWAVKLIEAGRAYVDDLSLEEMREYRGTLTEPGRESPYRNRSVEENLDLFARMRAGEFADGAKTLRAKIDMAAPNLNLRDPVMYRIRRDGPPPHGRCLVHLPHVRLGPRAERLDGGHHALHLHPGVRGPPPALRLVPRGPGHLSPAADRVRPAEPQPHRDEQAQAPGAGGGRPRRRAGTIRACPPSPACGGAATRRRPSATSASASAWPRPTTWSTWPCSSTACART